MRYIFTIDREDWEPTKRLRIWKKHWWMQRLNPLKDAKTIGRTVFELDPENGRCQPLFSLPQKLLESDFSQADYTKASKVHDGMQKSLSRGLRAVTQREDGGYLVNDIFGVYDVDSQGNVKRYLTKPFFADLHCVLGNKNNDNLLVSSTAAEEIFEIDWNGNIAWKLSLPELYGLNPSKEFKQVFKEYSDYRMLPLNMRRELFHVNWTEWIDEGSRMILSMCQPGLVVILEKQGSQWRVEKTWSLFPHCHGPMIDKKRGTFVVAVSRTNQVKEIDMETGRTIWTGENVSFGKRAGFVNDKVAYAGDCNQKRIVEFDRETGREIRAFELPGIPYDVRFLNH